MTADELTTNILNSEDLAQAIVKKFIDLDGKFVLSLSLSQSEVIKIIRQNVYVFTT